MQATEYLLTCLAEEAAEIVKDSCKSLRFGLDDVYTHIDAEGVEVIKNEMGTNRDRLIAELNDLAGTVRLLQEYGIIPEQWGNNDKQKAKIEKLRRYSKYSKKVGALDQEL